MHTQQTYRNYKHGLAIDIAQCTVFFAIWNFKKCPCKYSMCKWKLTDPTHTPEVAIHFGVQVDKGSNSLGFK